MQAKSEALGAQLDSFSLETLTATLHDVMQEEWQQLGVGAQMSCKAAASPRPVLGAPVIWRQGSAALRDYGVEEGYPVLVIPSLINRAYILDMGESQGFLRFMAEQGLRPFLLEWDDPVDDEHDFTPQDYVTKRMLPACQYVHSVCDQPPLLLGYCMGGVLALALAGLSEVKGVALLATPWDFHVPDFTRIDADEGQIALLEKMLSQCKTVPADMVQSLFYYLHPSLVKEKLMLLAGLRESAGPMRLIERWANDGIAMTVPTAKTCWFDWVQHNALVRGNWLVDGKAPSPCSLDIPMLFVMPERDRIVPPSSTQALIDQLQQAGKIFEILRPDTGHVGMIAGLRAPEKMWEPCVAWLKQITDV